MPGPLTKAGRYEIVAELGRGSMGVVYQGFDPLIGRTVAIKTMLVEGLPPSEFEEYKQRFQREAQSAGVLTHPNIVTVYDFGEDSGVLYLAMEYLEGKSIQELVDKHNIMPIETLVPMYEQICSALDHAHQHKIVHRDVKPANIMILDSGLVKVMDFGIAKVMSMGMTQAGQILGTPNYMSPEQVKGRQVDGRSDIFSLGVILYELVTGEKPFGGQNITTVIYKIINEDPIPPRQLDATIHPGLSYVISKSLAKNPEERYQTCRELAEDLRNYKNLGGLGAPSATLVIRVPPIQAQPTETVVPASPPPLRRSSPHIEARPAPPQIEQRPNPPHPAPVAAPAPQPQRAPVPPPMIAAVQPAPKSSAGVAWAIVIILLLAGMGGGGFYYYNNIYFPAHQPTGQGDQTGQPGSNPGQTTPSVVKPNPASPAGGQNGQGTNPAPTTNTDAGTTTPPITPVVKTGKVEVESNVNGADIMLDGKGTGSVTPHIVEMSAGSHDITLHKDGYNDTTVSVVAESGQTVPKTIEMAQETVPVPAVITPQVPKKPAVTKVVQPKPPQVTPAPTTPTTPVTTNTQEEEFGEMTISTTPVGLDISVDGQSKGQSPINVKLPAGNHTFTFTCPDMAPTTKTLLVKVGTFATHSYTCEH